jgi:hypothetical protein
MGPQLTPKATQKEGRPSAAFPTMLSQLLCVSYAPSADMTSPNSSQVSPENLASFTDWIG